MTEAAGIGHNSQLTIHQIVDRVVNLKEQRKDINGDIRQVMHDAEIHGFSKTAVKEAIRMFEMDPEDRAQFNADRQIYLEALDLI